MASLIRNINRLTKKSWTVYNRTITNTANSDMFKNIPDEDQPIQLTKSPFEKEQQQCILCRLNIEPDYKNVRLLSQFQSVYTGRIYGKHITGLCEAKQAKVEQEILKAQNCGFMAYYLKDPKYTHDPKIFNPDHPFRPHKF